VKLEASYPGVLDDLDKLVDPVARRRGELDELSDTKAPDPIQTAACSRASVSPRSS
jgi:hypothetical protein